MSEPLSSARSMSRTGEQTVEEFAGPLANFAQSQIQPLLVQGFRSPAFYQTGEHLKLRLRRGKAAFGMARDDPLAMIDGTVERSSFAEEVGVFAIEMTHLFDHVDALGGVQHAVKDSSAFEPEIHQSKIDVVVAADDG